MGRNGNRGDGVKCEWECSVEMGIGGKENGMGMIRWEWEQKKSFPHTSNQDETSPSIAAVSAPSAAYSMLAMQLQKRLCRQFVDMSAAR